MNLVATLFLSSLAFAPAHRPLDSAFGLNIGSKWTYRQTSDGRTAVITKQVVGKVPFKGSPIAEIKCTDSGYDFYEYRDGRAGLHAYSNAYLGGHPGVSEYYEPTLLLKNHVEAGDSWSWTRIVPVQTMGNTKIDPELYRENTTATVEAVEQPFKTTAGTFDVTIVRYDSVSKAFGKATVRRWISTTAGIVREERVTPKSKETLELLEFAPAGKAVPPKG